jgi:lipoprotein-releasing system ATP-binding protein
MNVLQATAIRKYFEDPVRVQVLDSVSLEVARGEFVSIVGKSGCGKSTLLYILSTMDTDYEGTLTIDGEVVTGKSALRLAHIRNEKIGFVFQFHYLLEEFTVLQNVMLPGIRLGRLNRQEVEQKAAAHLNQLGLSDQIQKKPSQLSGGQKQRVAIARALINDPLILICDEPTGNLDKRNSELVFDIFRELSAGGTRSLLVVTHDPDFAGRSDRIIEMADGKVVSDGK